MSGSAAGGDLLIQGALLAGALLYAAWTGAVAGSSTVALAIDGLAEERFRGFASRVAGAVRADLVALSWLEVSAVALLVLVRIHHPFFPHPALYWAGVLGSLVVGFALLGRFRAGLASGRDPALRRLAGLAGVGLVVTSSGLLWLGSGAILHPEQWGTSEPAFRVLLTWSGVGRFGEFTLLSFAGTGAILQRLGGRSPAPDEARFASRLGSGLALAALAAWPLALLFSHANLPSLALSVGTWGLAAAGVAVAAIAAWLAVRGWTGAPPLGGRALLAAAVVLLGAVVGSEQLARESVLVEAVLAGLSPAPPPPRPPPSPPPAPAPAPSASAGGGKVAAGKAVFDRICHLCHRFDARVVGPPLDAVVPKYRKDPEALRAFLRSPVKKDPAYPAMPKPAVTEAEIDAVAAYLLAEAKP